jgi:hypothetical protein
MRLSGSKRQGVVKQRKIFSMLGIDPWPFGLDPITIPTELFLLLR